MRMGALSATVAACALLLATPCLSRAKPAADPDADCLACHSDKGLKSDAGLSVYVDSAKHKASVHAVLACTSCHTDIKEFPHPQRVAKVACATCHPDQAMDAPKSVHGALGPDVCEGCHGQAHETQPAASVLPRRCGTCHAATVKEFLASIHGVAAKRGGPDGPTCEACHGAAHKIVAVADEGSPVAKRNLPDTCASWHSNPAFLARYQIPFAHPVEAYRLSVHGHALAAGNQSAASCSDCHSSHAILPGRDPRSKTNHWKISATCGACHAQIATVYGQSIHGAAFARGAPDAPVCTDCHGEHAILSPADPQSPVNASRVSIATCGRCHGDERIEARYNLPADRVPTFAGSFHGLASRAGSQTVANCASCHGVHNIFPSSDPRSTVNAANLAHTCGACHPGAGATFAIGPVHVASGTQNESAAVKWIRRAYWFLIPATTFLMLFHHGIDFSRKLKLKWRNAPAQTLDQMNVHFRIAHGMIVISFPILVTTGFALKFPDSWWARLILSGESHFALRGTLHRAAALLLLASVVYHVVCVIVNRRDRVIVASFGPNLGDLRRLWHNIRYNLGLEDTRPGHTHEPSYVEKMEYWAFVWGTGVMTATGFLLWFNNFALRHFPKWVEDASTALHYYEAILATLSILVWHMYTVMYDPDVYPMDPSWITGKTISRPTVNQGGPLTAAVKNARNSGKPAAE
jgi:cytochrome b subunit of formate dehydrogenase